MSVWREIAYYANSNEATTSGTPTIMPKRFHRRHLFTIGGGHSGSGQLAKSLCGKRIFSSQMSLGDTESQKCGHCIRAAAKKGIKGRGE